MIVLDASALLAYLFKETGHEIVAKYIEDACISTVNLSEVAGRLIRDGRPYATYSANRKNFNYRYSIHTSACTSCG
jgi:PIN domain nuclease of toxin-antitoxin system